MTQLSKVRNNALFQIAIWLCLIGCNPQQEAMDIEGSDWVLGPFSKVDSLNPILLPSVDRQFDDPLSGRTVAWESRNVLNPAAVVRNDSVFLFYRAQDPSGTSRIGLAVSMDGLHFTKMLKPVFYPDEDKMKVYEWSYLKENEPNCSNCFDGVEDPRIVETPDGNYIMTYTAYDGRTARMALATSADLIHWEKQGLVLTDSAFVDTWSKSGSILTERSGQRIVAKKVNGRYWMYYGDTDIFMATSEDSDYWQPSVFLLLENGFLVTEEQAAPHGVMGAGVFVYGPEEAADMDLRPWTGEEE